MDRPADSQKPSKDSKAATAAAKEAEDEVNYNLHTLYLVFYNWISAVLWAAVFGRVILGLTIKGYHNVYNEAGWLTKWTQTLASVEITHSAFRIVRAPLLTTVMQVSSRFLLVWMIIDKFPSLAVSSPAYTSMLIAWSITEVIRYSYFVATLAFGSAPDYLKWLRYNTFIILYPLGISSEVWLVCLACEPARKYHPWFEQSLWAVLAFYVPGSYILFTHMLAQRKKIMQGKGDKKTK